jgi:minor extracellular serine protease Vpr
MQGINGMLAALVAGAALLASCPPDAAAQQGASGRFKALPRSSGPIAAHRQPLSLLGKQPVKVVVQMDVASVAEVRANAPGHVISEADHSAIHTQIDRQQATIEPAIVSRGGTILAHFHDAMNGIKVQIARSEVAGLAGLPGVLQVVPVSKYNLKNVVSVPFIGAPQVWQGTPGFRGEHVKIAIIDTGIDYTHANFGGPGTVAAFMNAAANSTAPADPTMFGPQAPKVKGGTDLVGDNYDADVAGSTPVPDPNPLDCNGHGSHVSGTAAGFGVANDGTTFHGPYDAAVYSTGFGIGPGVAPLADLYAVRIFGCTGSTDVVTEGIDWAVHNNMDVINMSLGAPYGMSNDSDSIAADNAARAGIVVAVAAGNEGPAPYVAGSPATGTAAISVAATDARQFLVNGVRITLSSGGGANGVDANALNLPSGSIPAVILTSGGSLSLGCNATDYPAGGAAGAIVIVSRGTCTFDVKASNAMAAGAVAIGVVNNAATGFFNPALTGVTIPFIVLLQSDAATFASAPSPDSATVAFASVPDAGYRLAASFSSGGPRTGDGALKPNITAPGVNVFSTAIGTGNGGTYDSGTSMATPHVAGVAALAVQAHRNWAEPAVRAAVVETASPSALGDYAPRIEGAGLVQAVGATSTDVTVYGTDERGLGLLSFGVAEFTRDYHDSRELIVRNHGPWPATFAASVTPVGGVPHTLNLSHSTVSVRGHDETSLHVSLTVPVSTVGGTHDALGNDLYSEVAGFITLQPEGSANHGVTLQLPYYLVPRARSDVDAELRLGRNPHIRLSNRGGAIAGNGDFYAWGLKNPKTGTIAESFEPRAIGVQTNPISATDSILVFAVNSYARFSNPAAGEYDIYIDVNGDGIWDFVLFAADSGLVETGEANGQMATFLVNLATGAEIPEFLADAPTDGSIVLIPVLASDLGISPTNPRFSYYLNAFDATGAAETVPGIASFNAFSPSVSNAMFVPVPPNTTADVPVAINPAEFLLTPALGFMVVTEDNLSGASEANLEPLPH